MNEGWAIDRRLCTIRDKNMTNELKYNTPHVLSRYIRSHSLPMCFIIESVAWKQLLMIITRRLHATGKRSLDPRDNAASTIHRLATKELDRLE